jgi:hypothetical protein
VPLTDTPTPVPFDLTLTQPPFTDTPTPASTPSCSPDDPRYPNC